MSDAVLITAISTAGAVLVALVGVWVELVRNRKQRSSVDAGIKTVVAEVTPNGGSSMKDSVSRICDDVKEIRAEQSRHGTRLATLEARLSDHLLIHGRER